MTRLRACGLATLAFVVAFSAMLADAERRRASRDAARHDAAVALTGTSDLALSSSARWLRHPSLSEPAAAFSDLPASLDVDPAGAWIGPPRAILVEGTRR